MRPDVGFLGGGREVVSAEVAVLLASRKTSGYVVRSRGYFTTRLLYHAVTLPRGYFTTRLLYHHDS
ncbi:hypothetical protein N9F76_01560 [bacterium]|nr:hypothetical protein [bacterium]